MGRLRFSVTGFLIFITLLSFGMSAYVAQAEWLGDLVYTFFLGLLCLATAGAFLQRGGAQHFWLGFAIFGWCYWCVGFDATLSNNTRSAAIYSWGYFPSTPQPTAPRLFTSDLLDYSDTLLVARRNVGDKVMAQWRGGSYFPGTITQVTGGQYLIAWDDGSTPQLTPLSLIQPFKIHSRIAGHAMLGAIGALIGGLLVLVFFEPRGEEPRTK